jgi:hypothetical protein
MLISILIEVEDDSEFVDPDHTMGITNEAYERLTGVPSPLGWLGEITDIEKADA